MTTTDLLVYKLRDLLRSPVMGQNNDYRKGVLDSIVQVTNMYQHEREQFLRFLVWFRNNGERHTGLSIEQLVDKFYEEFYNEKQ